MQARAAAIDVAVVETEMPPLCSKAKPVEAAVVNMRVVVNNHLPYGHCIVENVKNGGAVVAEPRKQTSEPTTK